MTAIAARVSLGASLLDECMPGWENRTDPDILYMGSDVAGILGQLYGTYWEGLDALFGDALSGAVQQRLGVARGFFWDIGHSLDPDGESNALKDAWLREIAARKYASVPAVKPVEETAA